jgi:hypothetical protein
VIDISREKNIKAQRNESGQWTRIGKRATITLAIIGPFVGIWAVDMKTIDVFKAVPEYQYWIIRMFLSIFWALFLLILYFDDRISSVKRKGFVGLTYFGWLLILLIFLMLFMMLYTLGATP